jgi:hypothetical protein
LTPTAAAPAPRPPPTPRAKNIVESYFHGSTTFNGVGVKKKSFCGSINNDKPCLHIDFGKFSSSVGSAAEDLIGSRYLTLNNSI